MSLINQKLVSNNHLSDIKSWLTKNDIQSKVGNVIIHPTTFEPAVTIMINKEVDTTAYYLRWR